MPRYWPARSLQYWADHYACNYRSDQMRFPTGTQCRAQEGTGRTVRLGSSAMCSRQLPKTKFKMCSLVSRKRKRKKKEITIYLVVQTLPRLGLGSSTSCIPPGNWKSSISGCLFLLIVAVHFVAHLVDHWISFFSLTWHNPHIQDVIYVNRDMNTILFC